MSEDNLIHIYLQVEEAKEYKTVLRHVMEAETQAENYSSVGKLYSGYHQLKKQLKNK